MRIAINKRVAYQDGGVFAPVHQDPEVCRRIRRRWKIKVMRKRRRRAKQ